MIGAAMLVAGLTLGAVSLARAGETSSEFTGHHVNSGAVSHEVKAGRHVLTMSKDFAVPEAPDPHWRVVDSKGQVFLLDRVKLKDDKINKSITLPPYVRDVAKVQFCCAFVGGGPRRGLVRQAGGAPQLSLSTRQRPELRAAG